MKAMKKVVKLAVVKMNRVKRYLTRVVTAASMLLCVIIGGPIGQTFSARQHEKRKQGRWHLSWLVDLVFGKDHCVACWAMWKIRKW